MINDANINDAKVISREEKRPIICISFAGELIKSHCNCSTETAHCNSTTETVHCNCSTETASLRGGALTAFNLFNYIGKSHYPMIDSIDGEFGYRPCIKFKRNIVPVEDDGRW